MTGPGGERGVDSRPARLSQFLAGGAVLFVLGTAGVSSTLSLLLASGGTALAGSGLFFGRSGAVTAGLVVLLSAVLAAGVAGASTLRLLSSVAATVFAWDVGRNAIHVGNQLGRDAETVEIELVHAAGTLVVASFAGALGYWLFVLPVAAPSVALLALLIAGTLLAVALEPTGTVSGHG